MRLRTAIVGVGAMGGLIAGRMLAAGIRVTLLDTQATAQRLRERGLTLIEADGAARHYTDLDVPTPGSVEPHDVVILAVKAHEIAAAVSSIAPLLRTGTTVVTLQNGLPWWYFLRGSEQHAGTLLRSVDPTGSIAATLDARRILGCVSYPAAELLEPGVIRHVEGNRFPVGEPDGTRSTRAAAVAQLFVDAGFKSPVLDDIRSEIWLKAWGNLSFNPVSALTGATMAGICRLAESRSLIAEMMREAERIALGLGIRFRVDLERRLQGAERVGEHKTSMLQDLEAGRPLEYEALVGSVLEMARLQQLAAPTIESVYALIKLRDLSRAPPALAAAGHAQS
ncbi:MAG: 2-dehydropantoate 2-reductase [Steroidobacteraceae bacterium]